VKLRSSLPDPINSAASPREDEMSKIVDRTLDFIELFARERKPLSLSEISRLLGIPFSSCHDVLQALNARGYVYEIGPRAGFYPTTLLLNLATSIAQHDPIVERAEIALKKLRDDVDESVSLAVAADMKATYLLVFEPSHPLRFLVEVGSEVRSLHATSAGKAFLGSLPPEKFDEYLKGAKLAPLTSKSITAKTKLRADIEAACRRGWFLNRGESVEDATTLSSFFHWNGSTYIVTIAGPEARVEPKLQRAAERLLATCRRLDGATVVARKSA
jgi:DNA-binding IclR family transcriptional regulator